MQDPAIVYSPPVKKNIAYFVHNKSKEGIPPAFNPIVERLITQRNMGRVIIFCRTYGIHCYFCNTLEDYVTEPKGSPNCCIQSSRYVYTQHISVCQGKDFETVHITLFLACNNNCNNSIYYGD